MKKLFTLLLVTQVTFLQSTSKCNNGCLRCTSVQVTLNQFEDICVSCDTQLKYYLKKQTCVLSQVDNCQMINSIDGTCSLCNTNFYLDRSTRKCVQISPDKQIIDCIQYDTQQNCITCQSGKYLSEKQCQPVQEFVTNCKIYQTSNLCKECDTGYYLINNQKECKVLPTQQNCSIYSQFKCLECDIGYLLEKNAFLKNLEKFQNQNDVYFIEQLQSNEDRINKLDNSFKVCQKTLIDNCKVYEDFQNCKECNQDYYLNQNQRCTQNPVKFINNCSLYENENKCLECYQGYILQNNKECIQIQQDQQILGCKLYQTNISDIQCNECFSAFFLQFNTCKERVNNKIENCDVYSNTQDKCQQCNTNYSLSLDGLLCLQTPDNCQATSNFSNQITQDQLTCQQCNQGYYVDSTGQCTQGVITNCKIYQQNSNQCQQCIDKFFVIQNDKTCYGHTDIEHCEVYHQTDQNQCQQCNEQYQNLKVLNYCKTYNEIDHCLEYTQSNSTLICSQCVEGYEVQNGSCVFIDITITPCKTYDSCNELCTQCNDGFGLDDGINGNKPSCRLAHEYIQDNCLSNKFTNEPNDFNEIECQICKENSFPFKNKYGNVCINKSLMGQAPLTSTTTLIEYCKVYNRQGQCILCEQGKYISQDKSSCVTHCNSTYIISISYDDNYINTLPIESYVYFNNQNQCGQQRNDDNVYMTAPAIGEENQQQQINIKCKNWITSINNLNQIEDKILYTNVNPNTNDNYQYVTHPLDVYNSINCPKLSLQNHVDGQPNVTLSNLRSDCQLFLESSTNDFGCIKCNWGLVGDKETYKTTNSGITTLGTCQDMSTCNKEIKYKNINAYWNQFYSCHKCKDNNSIPVLTINTSGISNPDMTGFVRTNQDNTINSKQANGDQYNSPLKCIDTSSKSNLLAGLGFSNDISDSNVNLLQGCGIGIFNSNYENTNSNNKIFNNSNAYSNTDGNISTSNIGLLCGSCKPGYKAQWYQDKKNIVRSCTQIENCSDGGSLMNACQTCEEGYTYRYNDGIKWDECVEIEQENQTGCYAYELNTTSGNKCRICKKGYYLNKNNYCEKIIAPNCNTDNFIGLNEDLIIKKNSKYALYIYQNGYGCIDCQSDYISYPINKLYVQNYCVNYQSDSVKVELISGCKLYHNNLDQLQCFECKDNYVKTNDNQGCISNDLIPNCVEIETTVLECKKCQEGYTLFNDGTCLKGNINNCQSFYHDEKQSQQLCRQCNDGFYLLSNKLQCLEGKILNCGQYEDNNDSKCIQCKENYWVVDDGKYCLEAMQFMNCPKVQISISDKTIKCIDSCKNKWELKVSNTLNSQVTQNQSYIGSHCFKKQIITNCKISQNVLNTSGSNYSFICQECEDGFYLSSNNKECKQRTVQPLLCSKYKLDQDKCLLCKEGSYLKTTNNKQECMSILQDFYKCQDYKLDTNGKLLCDYCEENYYLNDQTCQQVPQDNLIQNCKFYKEQNTCLQCQENYLLIDNECKQIQVNNCDKYINEQSCEVCLSGYRLKEEDGFNKCEIFSRQNCQKFEQTGDNKCILCKDNYYPNEEGECIAVTNLIENCLEYLNNNQCKKCQQQYALSSDNTQCVSKQNFDTNCIQQVMPSNLECSLCQVGYHFQNGSCVKLSALNNLQGCDYPDIEDQTKCFVCKSNYYMKNDKKCYQNGVNNNGDGDDNNDDEDSFSFRLQSIIYILYIISF